MDIKKQRIVYFALLLATLVLAGMLELITVMAGSLLPIVNHKSQYIFSVCFTLILLLCCFLAIRFKNLNPMLRMALIMWSANLVILDYFFLSDTNLLYALPLLAVAYIFVWPKD